MRSGTLNNTKLLLTTITAFLGLILAVVKLSEAWTKANRKPVEATPAPQTVKAPPEEKRPATRTRPSVATVPVYLFVEPFWSHATWTVDGVAVGSIESRQNLTVGEHLLVGRLRNHPDPCAHRLQVPPGGLAYDLGTTIRCESSRRQD